MKKLILLMTFIISFTSHASESFGTYTRGSQKESGLLARNDYGLQTMRRNRKRFHGHDQMISFIKDLSADSYQNGFGQLLVGDIAQKNGGNASGHASHQNGLDVDIWFWRPKDSRTDLSDNERETISSPLYLEASTNTFKYRPWDTRLDKVLKMAAMDDRVARIFVNPGVKKRLCELYPKQNFLKKIRPWWRHHEHFHVRLKCPKDSPKCIKQAPSLDIECDSPKLAWWFGDEFKREYRRRYGERGFYKDFICEAE